MDDRYFNKQGKPIDVYEWGKLFGDNDYKRISYTDMGDVTVSTVWLGLDHRFGEGSPLIFETMVFGGKHDQEMDRYSTLEEALAGHRAMVEKVTLNN